MTIQRVKYSNKKLVFLETDDILIDYDAICNLFNWNTLYKINYLGGGDFNIVEKINGRDAPELKEDEEYILYYE